MLGSASVVAFVPTRNPSAAREFYEGALGLRFESADAFALVFDANGVPLRVVDVTSVSEFRPAPFTILGWHVPSVASAATALRERGVTFERYEGMGQDALGIWTSPSGARIAWFKDPDGNVLAITEY
jgi:catechol 2,3-dioxygenase-like lactoylglutathione lyase family enzyme